MCAEAGLPARVAWRTYYMLPQKYVFRYLLVFCSSYVEEQLPGELRSLSETRSHDRRCSSCRYANLKYLSVLKPAEPIARASAGEQNYVA